MTGRNVFYPMGWDDNGLPTERRVQNYFHIRCDPSAPYEPEPRAHEASAQGPQGAAAPGLAPEFHRGVRARDARGRALVQGALRAARPLDRLAARVPDDRRARAAHRAVLVPRSLRARATSRAAMRRRCGTSTSSARWRRPSSRISERPGAYHDIEFAVEGGGAFTISTTRPELLAACVGVTAHPGDARYQRWFGKRAITPLFRVPVPIFPSEKADPEKGTGILMVCTFGDATDVEWWREERLALRQLVQRNGRLAAVEFGSAGYESLDPGEREPVLRTARRQERRAGAEDRRRAAARPGRQRHRQRRAAARRAEADRARGEVLREGRSPARVRSDAPVVRAAARAPRGAAREGRRGALASAAHGQALRGLDAQPEQRLVRLAPALFRRADSGLVSARRERRARLRAPDPARCVRAARGSHHRSAAGLHRRAARAAGRLLGRDRHLRHLVHELAHAADQLALGTDPKRHAALFPADLRPQGQDIIRTWAFYTIAKALLHENSVPWRHSRCRASSPTPTARRCRRARAT